VVTDVETWCPGRGGRHHLVEIAAVVYDRRGHIARSHLTDEGLSGGSGGDPPLIYQQLCRPEGLPRRVRLHNAIDPGWLWQPGVPSERQTVIDFAEWHFGVARGAPLIAYNRGFDRSALRRALSVAQEWADPDEEEPFPWGPCLMQDAARLLGGRRGKMPKEVAAGKLLNIPDTLARIAREIGHRGPLTMHLGLPDALLEGALMIALRQRELAAGAAG
jgi:hypothetical protein